MAWSDPLTAQRAAATRSMVEALTALDSEPAADADLARMYALSVNAYHASNIRANAISQIRFRVKQGEQELKQHPLARLVNTPAFSDIQLRSELTLCFWGHNLIFKQRMRSGRLDLRWLNPRVYSRDADAQRGLQGFHVVSSTDSNAVPRYIYPADGIYYHGVDFDDDFGGVAPAEVAFNFAGIETEAAQTALWFLRNRAVPGGLLQPAKDDSGNLPPDKGALEKIRNLLSRLLKGSRNAGRTVATAGRWEWLAISQEFDKLGMTDMFEQAGKATAKAFNMSVELMEMTGTYAGAYQADTHWVENWLKPRANWYAGQYTEQLAREYGPDIVLEPDFSPIKRDEQAVTAVVNSRVQAGYLSLYDAQLETGGTADERFKDIYLVGMTPMHIDRIVELAHNAPASGETTPVLTGGDLPALPDKLPPRPDTPLLPEPVAAPVVPATAPETTSADVAPANLESTIGLNGAQIDAALRILDGVRAGNTAPEVAVELLMALGLEEGRARRMVEQTAAMPAPMSDDLAAKSGASPTLVPDWMPDAAFKELRDCVRIFARKGADHTFTPAQLPSDVVAYVRLLAATDADGERVLAAARQYYTARATDRVAAKADDDIERRYRAALYDLLHAAFARQLDHAAFVQQGDDEIHRSFELAFLRGVNEAGTITGLLSPGELVYVREAADTEVQYWDHLAGQLFSEALPLYDQSQAKLKELNTATNGEERDRIRGEALALLGEFYQARERFFNRIDAWGKALRSLYHQGLLSGRTNPMLRWDLGATEKHCRTCLAAAGQIHRASEWKRYNLRPQGVGLDCSWGAEGQALKCDCRFTVVKEKARGSLSAIPRYWGKSAGGYCTCGHDDDVDTARSSFGPAAGTVVLYLGHLEALLIHQQVLQRRLPADAPVRWTPVEQWHLTLVHSALVDEPQFRDIYQEVSGLFQGFELHVSKIGTFPTESDAVPLIGFVDVTGELQAFQTQVVQAFQTHGVAVSDYSDPAQWQPHITFGYAPAEYADLDLVADLNITAEVLAFTRSRYETDHRAEGSGDV